MKRSTLLFVASNLVAAVLGLCVGIVFERSFVPMPHSRSVVVSTEAVPYTLRAFEIVNAEARQFIADRHPEATTLDCFVIPISDSKYEIVFSSGESQHPRVKFPESLKEELRAFIQTGLARAMLQETPRGGVGTPQEERGGQPLKGIGVSPKGQPLS